MSRPTSNNLQEAVSALAQVKQEHREILDRIAADEGMSSETRRVLVAHVLEEEDEHVSALAQVAGSTAGPSSSRPPSGSPALSVGSLRAAEATPSPGKSVGSLRRP